MRGERVARPWMPTISFRPGRSSGDSGCGRPYPLNIRIPGRCAARLNERRGWRVHDGAGHYPCGVTHPEAAAGRGPAMRQILLVVIGIAAALAGLVWTLQGLGYVGGSFMSGATVWAVIGPLVALAGLALIVVGLRARRRVR